MQEILRTTKVKDVLDFLKKYNFIKINDKYFESNVSHFLKKFREKFIKKDKHLECKIIDLVEDLFKHLKLHKFYGKAFYYEL